MHYDPKCQNNKHKCTQICTSVICRLSNPFVCSSCDNHHKADTCEIIPYKKMVKQFHKIQGLYTNQMLKYEQRVQNTFSQLMSKLRAEFVKFRQQFEYININQKISDIYQKIKKNKENELTGQKIHWALKSKCRSGVSYKVKDQLTMRMQKQSIFEIFIQAVQKLPPYYSFKNVEEIQQHSNLSKNHIKMIQDMYMDQRKITSGIMGDQFKYLEEMMGRQIYNIHLLYRATQNNFEAQAFHKKCDGIANTVTIAKTQFNNIVIGYCPFPWESASNWVYKEDRNQQCFLISPSKDLKGKKFTPFKTKFAIGMHKDYGPSFGDDFVIYDKAHHSKNCWSNFPDVYTCKSRPVQHNSQTITSFVGVKDHYQKFNLKEWQVYKLSFGRQDQQQNSYVKIYKTIPQNQH